MSSHQRIMACTNTAGVFASRENRSECVSFVDLDGRIFNHNCLEIVVF